jgi:hypothetical protein
MARSTGDLDEVTHMRQPGSWGETGTAHRAVMLAGGAVALVAMAIAVSLGASMILGFAIGAATAIAWGVCEPQITWLTRQAYSFITAHEPTGRKCETAKGAAHRHGRKDVPFKDHH